MMTQGAIVLPVVTRGRIDPSAIRRLSIPYTLRLASTTDIESRPIFAVHIFPYMDRPNLTVLSNALVTRVTFAGQRATGVELSHENETYRIHASLEVVLSLGAIHTPKVLMQSGVGDQAELQRHGIPLLQHLPGVGKNFQDHPAFGCVWESADTLDVRNTCNRKLANWQKTPDLRSKPPFRMAMKLAAFLQLHDTMSVTFLSSVCPNTRGRWVIPANNLLKAFRVHCLESDSSGCSLSRELDT